jgi:hypothetical protein
MKKSIKELETLDLE